MRVSTCVLGDGNFFMREPHICKAEAITTCEVYVRGRNSEARCETSAMRSTKDRRQPRLPVLSLRPITPNMHPTHPFCCACFARSFSLEFDDFWTCLHNAQITSQFVSYLDENRKELLKFGTMVEKMLKNLNSNKMAKMMEEKVDDGIAKHIILPESTFRRVWGVVSFIALCFSLFNIPYRIR